MRIYYLIAIFILIIDQATKFWILYVLQLEKLRSFDVFSPYLTFQFAWNKGINFGLFSSNEAFVKWVLIFITLLICFFITLYTFKVLTTNFERTMAGFVLGGAAGNVFDRFFHGAVVDFLNMSCCGWRNPFSFNVADIAIFAGAFGLLLFSEKLHRRA